MPKLKAGLTGSVFRTLSCAGLPKENADLLSAGFGCTAEDVPKRDAEVADSTGFASALLKPANRLWGGFFSSSDFLFSPSQKGFSVSLTG